MMFSPSPSDDPSLIIGLLSSMTAAQLVLAILTLLISWCAYNFFLHPLAKYPGPLAARIGLPGSVWAFWQAYNYRFVWSLQKWHDRHGSVVRIGRTHLSFNTAQAAQQIYAHGVSKTLPKTDFYRSFQTMPNHPSVFSELNPDKHAAFRRATSGAYSMNSIVKLQEYLDPLISSFLHRLQEQSSDEQQTDRPFINMAKWLHFFAMDAVGELAFGSSFGFVKEGRDDFHFLQGVSNLSHWGSMAGWLPAASTFLRLMIKYTSGQPGGEVVARAAWPLIERRYALLNMKQSKQSDLNEKDSLDVAILEDRQDMLSNFIRSKHPSTGALFTPLDTLRTAISVIGAGSDTTSTALTAFVGYMVRNPDVYARMQREIDQAFELGQLTWPVAYEQAVKLPYLQACIKETLRLHPPISMSIPRFVNDKQGMLIQVSESEQVVVPNGCQVSVSPFVLHRNTAVYGDDARTFNPLRWLDLNESERASMERSFLSFGNGARMCIGKNISLMEINKVIPSLLRAFTFKVPRQSDCWLGKDSDGQTGKEIPWRCRSTWFLEVEEFPVNIIRRQNIDLEA